MLQKIVTLLYVSGDSLSIRTIADIIGEPEDEIRKKIKDVAEELSKVGLLLMESKEGLVIVTDATMSEIVEKFWKVELEGDLTPATLQVLTLVAYLGSPTREEISYVRGVQSSQSVRTLTVRGLIQRQGEVCTLTSEALSHLGITKVNDLPDYESIHNDLVQKLEVRNN